MLTLWTEKMFICNIINRFITEDRRAPKSAGPVAIATFATVVNPALLLVSTFK